MAVCWPTGLPPLVLIRIETRAGHSGGKPMSKVIEESSDLLAFLLPTVGKG